MPHSICQPTLGRFHAWQEEEKEHSLSDLAKLINERVGGTGRGAFDSLSHANTDAAGRRRIISELCDQALDELKHAMKVSTPTPLLTLPPTPTNSVNIRHRRLRGGRQDGSKWADLKALDGPGRVEEAARAALKAALDEIRSRGSSSFISDGALQVELYK